MKTIAHHPEDATLLSYAAGSLDESHALVVASHLDWCPVCARAVADSEIVGGVLVDGLDAEPLAPGARDRLLAAIAAAPDAGRATSDRPAQRRRGIGIPAPLARVLPAPLGQLPWRKIGKGVALYDVKLSREAKGKLRIWRLAPGQETPEHGHGGTEITMILQGSLTDCMGTFRLGDVEDLGDDVEHRPVAGGEEDCICMIASDMPTRFKGFLPRLLQPIFRF